MRGLCSPGRIRDMSVSSGLPRTLKQEKLTFHQVYEAKLREEALEGKIQREKKHRAERFLMTLNSAIQPFIMEGRGLSFVNLTKLHSHLPESLSHVFLVRVEHKWHSAWDSRGMSEGSYIVLGTESFRQGHLLQHLHAVTHLQMCLCFHGEAAKFAWLHLPSETPTDSPTPGAHAYLALWQRAPAPLCPPGLQVVKEWHRFEVILIGPAHVHSVSLSSLFLTLYPASLPDS